MKMKHVVFVSITSVLMFGCATASKQDIAAAAHVKVTDLSFLNAQSGCKKLGPVAGNSAGDVGGQSAAITDLKVKANKIGANIVASSLQFEKTMGVLIAADSVKGIALHCPEDVHAKVTTLEELAKP